MFFLSSCGCQFPITSKGQGEAVPAIAVDVAIKQKGIYQGPVCDITISGDFAYFQTTSSIQKFNLFSQSTLWKVNEDETFSKAEHIEFGAGDIILQDQKIYKTASEYGENGEYKAGYVLVLDEKDGKILERIRLLNNKHADCFGWVAFNNRLYFGYSSRDNINHSGVGYIDLTELSEDSGSEEANTYTAPVHTIMEIPHYCSAMMGVRALAGDRYGYFVWYPYEDTVVPGDENMPRQGMVAIDLENGEIAWQDKNFKAGLGSNVQLISDKFVFVFEYDKEHDKRGLAIYNKETGEKRNLWNVWSASKDFILDETTRRIYLTSGTAVEEFPQVAAIYCLNADTGDIIWSRYRDGSEPQIGMQPQVRNGVLYVPTARYLELYDASTGTPLGRDSRVYGDGENFGDSAVWKDLILFHDGNETLFGVKMNWKVVNGQLVKEE